MKQLLIFLTIFFISGLVSCKKDNSNNEITHVGNTDKIAPEGFNFKTSKDVNVDITLRSNNNQPLTGVIVSIYDPANTTDGAALYKGATDKNGNLKAKINVASYLTRLVIDPAYVGLIRYATANINGSSTTVTIGGATGFSGDIVPEDIASSSVKKTNRLKPNGLFTTDFVYPTGYTAANAFSSPVNLGRPAYRETTGDVIDASLLSYINASLPEGTPLTTTHPEYLTSSVTSNLNITAKSDLWITYVSEGAGYKNALAYFTYKTATPPTMSSGGYLFGGIDKITYIFPNSSGSGSGGGLVSGDKVKLGTFEAGTSIGFVLIQDAWTGSGVDATETKFFSLDKFNPETTTGLKKHSVVLYDDVHKLFY